MQLSNCCWTFQRSMLPELLKMRCKTAIGLCVFIGMVHLTLLVLMHGTVLADLSAEMKVRIYSSGEQEQVHQRSKRNTEEEANDSSERQLPKDSLDEVELVTVSPSAQCRTGHVQGLRPVCAFGCLRRLYVGNPSFFPPREEVVPTGVRQEIVSMGGKLHNVHISLVSHITDMQWQNGIFGTIGEIGAYEGQMTKVMSYNIDTAAGERLFVSDHFENLPTSRPKDRLQDVFADNMKAVDFHVDTTSEDRKLFMHVGTPSGLTEELMQEMDLPQFRFMSINGDDDSVSILTALERASCMLRDGGVIVVSGIQNRNSEASHALKHYFQRHGTAAFSPFIVVRNKVYLTTTNWKDRAQRYFVNNDRLALIFNFREVTTNTFGPEMVYLTQKR